MSGDSAHELSSNATASTPLDALRSELAALFARSPEQWGAPLVENQCMHWQKGERILAEAYLSQVPELSSNASAVRALIQNEMLLREQHGEAVSPQEAVEHPTFP
jgi:hypothetical protein